MVSRPFLLTFLSFASLLVAGCAGNNGDGDCPMPCASAEICCDGVCVLPSINQQHCGGCGRPCAGTCTNGMCLQGDFDASTGRDSGMQQGACQPACTGSQMCCGSVCVERSQPVGVDGRPNSANDPRSPFNNCNGCGFRCDPERANSCSVRAGNTIPECSCGNFPQCPADEKCLQGSGGFQCVNFSTSTEHCGELNNRCAEGEICSGGVCRCGGGESCGEGQKCCGGICVDISSDAMNCGACGNVCGGNAPNCQAGSCVCGTGPTARACAMPTPSPIPLLPPNLGESCCDGECVANTDTNCGCGVMCDAEGGDSCIIADDGDVCCGVDLYITAVCSGGGIWP